MGWQQHWYPVMFVRDVGREPYGFAIHDQRFVLFRAEGGSLQVLEDLCPHRGARLSNGTVRAGQLECGYHGWRFGENGRCLHIPQLPAEQSVPERAHVATRAVIEQQGIVWVWLGSTEGADPKEIATVPDLDRADVQSVDFTIDLPYDQTFLIENVIDVAHIHIAHDGIRGGGLREMAAPLHFEIEGASAKGLRASFRSVGVTVPSGSRLRGASVEFRAPNLVHYRSLHVDAERIAGLALYSLPVGRNRCRLIYRSYSNFRRLRDRLRPRWLEHWTQCTILEQDMAVVVGQAEHLNTSGHAPRELWLPLKSSDSLVIAYRKWLDEHAKDWPYAIGFARSSPTHERPQGFDRYTMHTKLCAACSRASGFLQRLRTPLILATVGLLAVAAVLPGSPWSTIAGGLAILAAVAWVVAERAENRFH